MSGGTTTVVEPLTLQMRLEAVWKKLKVSIEAKMDYALKYSSDKYLAVLDEVHNANFYLLSIKFQQRIAHFHKVS